MENKRITCSSSNGKLGSLSVLINVSTACIILAVKYGSGKA